MEIARRTRRRAFLGRGGMLVPDTSVISPSHDRRFARYRRTGDARALAALIDRATRGRRAT
jgi:hypothetical protein